MVHTRKIFKSPPASQWGRCPAEPEFGRQASGEFYTFLDEVGEYIGIGASWQNVFFCRRAGLVVQGKGVWADATITIVLNNQELVGHRGNATAKAARYILLLGFVSVYAFADFEDV